MDKYTVRDLYVSGNGSDEVYLASERDASTAELEKAHTRYELIRTLNPREFTRLWKESIAGVGRFDDLVDQAIESKRFAAKSVL